MEKVNITSPKAINSFKTALAAFIGYLISIWTHLPQSQWIVITILVVMSAQTSIGSLYLKAKMRFWGTFCGALASLVIIIICGSNAIGIAISLFLATLVFAYIAGTPGDASYLGTLGAVTVVIIILNPNANYTVVGERFLEIVLGIVISFLVSIFILPVRSHTIFLNNLGSTLLYLQEYFKSCFDEPVPDLNIPFHDLNEKILGIFAQQRRLIQETALEFGKRRKDHIIFKKIMNTERKVYRAINLIFYSLNAAPASREIIQSLDGFESFKTEVAQFLESLGQKVKNRDQMMIPNFKNSHALMTTHFKKLMTANLDYEQTAIVNTFLFSVDFLSKELNNLQLVVNTIHFQ